MFQWPTVSQWGTGGRSLHASPRWCFHPTWILLEAPVFPVWTKQAGRTWNKTLDQKLGELGFARLDAETCLYVFRKDGQVCFLVVYVDDLLLAATTQKFMDSIKAKLSASFKMWNLGEAKYILGIEIKRNRKFRTISLSQSQYSRTVSYP